MTGAGNPHATDPHAAPCAADGHQWGVTDEGGRTSCARCGMDRADYDDESGRGRPARLSDDAAPLAGNLDISPPADDPSPREDT